MVRNSARVLAAAGTFDMHLVCLRFQTDASYLRFCNRVFGCEIGL
jgi:hypothetical protein